MNTFSASTARLLIDASYLLVAFLFIMGLKQMSSPVTARRGILWAGAGMLIATLVSFAYPGMSNYVLILAAIGVGSAIAWATGKKVAMTDMPQMIALYNGMGGGAAAAIGAVELFSGEVHDTVALTLAVVGSIIGSVSFSGSLIAFGKLQGLIKKSFRFSGQQFVNVLLVLGIVACAFMVSSGATDMQWVTGLFVLALILGLTMTLPIGGADMPVVISL
jgi:NAD(P) transhydrogenase subunit beta